MLCEGAWPYMRPAARHAQHTYVLCIACLCVSSRSWQWKPEQGQEGEAPRMGSIGVRTLDGKHTSFAFSGSDTGHSVKQHLRATWGYSYRLLFRVRALSLRQ